MSKKKKTAKPRFPWLFLSLILIFCLWMTYLYGVFYIPSLPHAEIPPYLISSQPQNTDHTQTTESASEDTKVQNTFPSDSTQPITGSTPTTAVRSEENVHSRRSGVYNILCAGRDDSAFNTDALLLVSFDAENGAANVVQIPRDTYYGGTKINALWARFRTTAKKNGIADADAAAMDDLCRALEQTLCIKIDHWVLCGLTAIRETVDAIGGVPIDVPYDMDYDDPAQNLAIHLTAGEQILNGVQAEGLIRFRSDYVRGDLGRVDMQKLFLSAMLEQGKKISLLRLPSLVTTAAKHITSDLSFSDLLFFAKNAHKLDTTRVKFLTLPGTDCREFGDSGAWYYVLSAQGTLEVVNQHLNVYDTAVDAALFDSECLLTNTDNQTMLHHYQAHLTADTATAAALDENGVHIAVIPK